MSQYDPLVDAAERWAGWTFKTTPLHGLGEVWDIPSKKVLYDTTLCSEEQAVAHIVAHLDLGHHEDTSGQFTTEQEDLADWTAELRLSEVPSAITKAEARAAAAKVGTPRRV